MTKITDDVTATKDEPVDAWTTTGVMVFKLKEQKKSPSFLKSNIKIFCWSKLQNELKQPKIIFPTFNLSSNFWAFALQVTAGFKINKIAVADFYIRRAFGATTETMPMYSGTWSDFDLNPLLNSFYSYQVEIEILLVRVRSCSGTYSIFFSFSFLWNSWVSSFLFFPFPPSQREKNANKQRISPPDS